MISAIVLTKNEEKHIETCLKSVKFCDEIIVIDSGSTDKTIQITRKYTDQIYKVPFTNFSSLRNIGKEKAKFNWILYVDADEEITKNLQDEILKTLKNLHNDYSCFFIERNNYYLGTQWPVTDKVERLFKKSRLVEWFGSVHESPKINGEKGSLKNKMIHRTHNDLEEMLTNTIVWSGFEARERFKTSHPKITWWRIFRVMTTSFWDYYIIQKGFKVGVLGLIESIYQAFSSFVTYSKLWELQNNNDNSKTT